MKPGRATHCSPRTIITGRPARSGPRQRPGPPRAGARCERGRAPARHPAGASATRGPASWRRRRSRAGPRSWRSRHRRATSAGVSPASRFTCSPTQQHIMAGPTTGSLGREVVVHRGVPRGVELADAGAGAVQARSERVMSEGGEPVEHGGEIGSEVPDHGRGVVVRARAQLELPSGLVRDAAAAGQGERRRDARATVGSETCAPGSPPWTRSHSSSTPIRRGRALS